MGDLIFDGYSLLHIITGVILFLLGIDFKTTLILHLLFETIENSPWGISILQQIPIWPGGKDRPDDLINMLGDTISAGLGWYVMKRLN